jgi:hypothetical protein
MGVRLLHGVPAWTAGAVILLLAVATAVGAVTLLAGPPPTALPQSTPAAAEGIWISHDELARLPQSGPAWERMKSAADGPLGPATVADFTATHDVNTLAVALVYGRTGDASYREKAADAIMAVIGTETTGQAVMLSRNVVCYVIAADLIDLASLDPDRDAQFRAWIDQARTRDFPDRTMVENDELRTNNHGRMAGAARAAIAVYLDDRIDLGRAAQVFRGFLGAHESYRGFEYRYGLTWQSDPAQPAGILPVGATKEGHDLDGAMPEEMRRGCEFQWPPCVTGYAWEGLGAALVEANILSRAGYDVWEWEDRALLRAVRFLERMEQEHGGWWATGDDAWQPWLVNEVYGTSLPTTQATRGKNMAWTDWMYSAAREP